MSPIISVVIPVFNAASYLPFTLRNIIEDQFQTMAPTDWEVIIVDDGSTDGSHLAAEPWKARFPESVHIIRKQNGGVSAARNCGLDAARGRYVYFMDSDDILLRGSLQPLCERAVTDGVDMMKFMFRQISADEYTALTGDVPQAAISPESIRVMDTKAYIEESNGMSEPKIQTSTWQSIYRREMLVNNSVRYDEELTVGEDEVFTWSAIRHAKTIGFTGEELFLYHQREGSISHADNRTRQERFQMERIRFCGKIIGVLKAAESLMSEQVFAHVNRNYLFGYYHSVIDLIVMGFPMRTIYRAMRLYRQLGGDVHPGRPRFTPFYDKHNQPAGVKLRRLAVAFLLGTFVKLPPVGK